MIFPATDAVESEPKPTALFSAIAAASFANSWTSVNGWSTPTLYSNITEEYEALNKAAGIVDFGPLCRYVARGSMAVDFFARVTTAPLKNLNIGESARGLILAASGAVVDVIDIARLEAEMFLMTSARPHTRRLQLAARGMDVTIEDITDSVAAVALIGPQAEAGAAAAGVALADGSLASQKVIRGVETAIRPINFGVQPGVEIIYPAEEALVVWERLRRAAEPRPVGLQALEILRIEGGTPRPDVDFASADSPAPLEDHRTAEALGLPHLAPLNRAWFNGRRALTGGLKKPQRLCLVVCSQEETLMAGAAVYGDGRKIGRVTSCAFSPYQRRALAFIDIANTPAQQLELADPMREGRRVAVSVVNTAEAQMASEYRAMNNQATEKRR